MAAGVLYAAKFAFNGMPQSSGSQGSLAFVQGHETRNAVVFVATALAGLLVALFSVGLRTRLRSAEGNVAALFLDRLRRWPAGRGCHAAPLLDHVGGIGRELEP